jgi:hypothetical protein
MNHAIYYAHCLKDSDKSAVHRLLKVVEIQDHLGEHPLYAVSDLGGFGFGKNHIDPETAISEICREHGLYAVTVTPFDEDRCKQFYGLQERLSHVPSGFFEDLDETGKAFCWRDYLSYRNFFRIV